jgi:predicted ABC-type ATPase
VRRPIVLVLAGVNGAGKSSVAGALLQEAGLDWFNPDHYARALTQELGLDIQQANARAWEFGRAALEAAIANRTNYAFETTLGGKTITGLLARAAKTHDVVMLYCGLSSPELHIERVRLRVTQGGHDIPEEKIRERWSTSRVNLIALLPKLAQLQVFDNSATVSVGQPVPDPVLVLEVMGGGVTHPDQVDPDAMRAVPAWARPIVEAAIRLPRPRHRRRSVP